MRFVTMLAGIALAFPAAAQRAPYKLEPGIDRAMQLAELLGLYSDLCLSAFPNSVALFSGIAGRKEMQPLTGAELTELFHDRIGLAWSYQGKSSRFLIAIEPEPVHSCTVRTTMIGFGEDASYRAVADRYEKMRKGFVSLDVEDAVSDGIRRVVAGDRKDNADGSSDALLMLVATPATEALRADGNSGVDVQLVHRLGAVPKAK